jgi:hypothetical protein
MRRSVRTEHLGIARLTLLGGDKLLHPRLVDYQAVPVGQPSLFSGLFQSRFVVDWAIAISGGPRPRSRAGAFYGWVDEHPNGSPVRVDDANLVARGLMR